MLGNPILDLLTAHKAMHVLVAATRLGIFPKLATRAMTAEELAVRCGAVPRLVAPLLDCCVAMGLLRRCDGVYSSTHLADAHLVVGRPRYLGDLIRLVGAEAGAWEGLHDLVRSGDKPPAPSTEPEVSAEQFTLAMHDLASCGEAEALAAALPLGDSRSMVDVGCGSGAYSIALCRRRPTMQAVLLDTEDVLRTTRRIVEQSGLGDRLELRPADIFHDAYGTGADLVLLSDVLYDKPEICRAMLERAYTALAPGGTLLVRGYFSDPVGRQPPFGAFFALSMLLADPDREPISLDLARGWVTQVGFSLSRVFTLTELSTCLIAVKPA